MQGQAGFKDNANMYRVGEYVYFENSASGVYAVRRIEELNKNANGNVEARVMCFYRRNEVPHSLVPLADKHHWGEADIQPDSDDEDSPAAAAGEETDRQRHKQRELFLSRQTETLPATLIRGKCSVTLLSEVEEISSYLNRDDAFFYALVFDPVQKTLLADRGSIRIGSEFQAQVPALLKPGEEDVEEEVVEEPEVLWTTNNNISEDEINQFIIIARSVGTFARALDCSSSVKQPSLHMSAAAASRDITVFHAYQALHAHNYNLSAALASLVPTTGPVLCRDEMEDWSSAEAGLFEEAMQKYGKDFNDIKKDFLPWKSMRNIIEYFFMWKTTDRYVQQKRVKALESEKKLKQVYIPSYTRNNSRVTGAQGEVMVIGKDCDAYPTMTKYSWSQYKKFGRSVPAVTTEDCFIVDRSLNTSKLTAHRPGLVIEPGSPSKAAGKTRVAFFLRTTPLMRGSRRVNGHLQLLKHHSRRPNKLIDLKALRARSLPLLADRTRSRRSAPSSRRCEYRCQRSADGWDRQTTAYRNGWFWARAASPRPSTSSPSPGQKNAPMEATSTRKYQTACPISPPPAVSTCCTRNAHTRTSPQRRSWLTWTATPRQSRAAPVAAPKPEPTASTRWHRRVRSLC